MQKNWPWPQELEQRSSTEYLVIHHTAGPQMQDTQEIWDEHIAIGDNGIAYHRIIKGDGTTVQGRPDDTVGAHALNVNHISVGIVLEGDFQSTESQEKPTVEQIAALNSNLNDLLSKYPYAKIIGHRDVADITNDPSVATACPGDLLYQKIPDIIKNL